MSIQRTGGRARRAVASSGALALVLLAAACGRTAPAQNSAAPTHKVGGVATFALPAASVPNWIFPMIDSGHSSVLNRVQFQYLMYRPLYVFGMNGKPVINPPLSPAEPPVYSNDNRTVSITLKPWVWSNGEKVDAQDVAFWLNMMKAEKSEWAYYVPGDLPDNLTSWKVTGTRTITLNLNKTYSSSWFTYNELSQITPLPAAWDKTSATATSACATTESDCSAVWSYLYGQSKDISTYASNPLWQVVDGPWHLTSYQSTGRSTFAPNAKYSGPVKPKLSEFIEEPFTTDDAELNVLRSGQLSVGYLPLTDVGQKALLSRSGYSLSPWLDAGINYFPYNFNNPTVGPIFKQLYVRQAIQHLINQPGLIKTVFQGYASPTYGPVPVKPANPYLDNYEKSNPYPYNVGTARSLLTSHGWSVHPNGVTTCTSPGSGSTQCGPGVVSGAKLDFNLVYSSGVTSLSQEMQGLKSTFAQVGIVLNLSQAPFDQVISQAVPCKPAQSSCSWEFANWGGGWSYSSDHFPNGDVIFGTGAGDNFGSYSNAKADALIAATDKQEGTIDADENFLAKNLPAVYMPKADYQLTEVQTKLRGVTPQEPTFLLTPENWYFDSSTQ